MILVRDIFQLKFGKAKDARESAKEVAGLMKKFGMQPGRFLFDLVGPFYTLVWETTYENLTAYEKMMSSSLGAKEFGKWYKKFVPLIESGRREIFTVVE